MPPILSPWCVNMEEVTPSNQPSARHLWLLFMLQSMTFRGPIPQEFNKVTQQACEVLITKDGHHRSHEGGWAICQTVQHSVTFTKTEWGGGCCLCSCYPHTVRYCKSQPIQLCYISFC